MPDVSGLMSSRSDEPPDMILGTVHVLDDVGPIRIGRRRPAGTAVRLVVASSAVLVFVVTPMVLTIKTALTRGSWDIPGIGPAMRQTIVWAVLVPLLVTSLGLLLADLLGLAARRDSPRLPSLSGRVVFLLIAPLAVPMVVTGIAFRLLFHPDPDRGLFTTRWFRFIPGDEGWLGPGWITMSLMVAFTWAWLGLATVVFRTALDRMQDMIVSGRGRIYPAEVEAALCSHPAVADCAVTGVVRREIAQAVVVLRSDISRKPDEQALLAYLDGRLSDYKRPKSIAFKEELPERYTGTRGPRPWQADFFRRYWPAGLGWMATTVFVLTAVMTSRTLDLILAVAPGASLDDASVVGVLHWRESGDVTTSPVAALGALWLGVVMALVLLCLVLLRVARWKRPTWPQPRRRARRPNRSPLNWWRSRGEWWRSRRKSLRNNWWRHALFVTLTGLWMSPLAVLVATSWHDRGAAATRAWWSKPSWFGFGSWSYDNVLVNQALIPTCVLALAVAGLVLVLASAAVRALEDMSSLGAHTLVVVAIGLALVPPQIVASQVNLVFGWGPLGTVPAWPRLLLVHVALAVPLAVVVLYSAGSELLGATRGDVLEAWAKAVRDHSAWGRLRAVVGVPWRVAWRQEPAAVTVAVLVFLQVWNDFVIGLLVGGQEAIPLTVHLFGQTRQFVSNSGPLAAASVVAATVPLVLLAVTSQRLIQGLVGKDAR